jgi:hypothetical protein
MSLGIVGHVEEFHDCKCGLCDHEERRHCIEAKCNCCDLEDTFSLLSHFDFEPAQSEYVTRQRLKDAMLL